jgi:murein lipoprotein
MKTTFTFTTRAAVIAVAAGLVAGCASTSDLERVEATANNAQSEARAAQQAATGAQSTAREAAAAAAEAQRTASEAQRCCNENTERLDRAFKRSMHK